tara:strand:- start:424 stop:1977 length:1554 start_codon:yes stop_codon:yes gene_type:complete
MTSTKQQNKAVSLTSRIVSGSLVIAILFLLNFILGSFNVRKDLTKDKLYTLSEYSKNIVQSLDDIVLIEFYTTKKLPPHVLNLKQQIIDLLDEFKAYGKGNIKLTTIHPGTSQQEAMKLQQLGIPKFQMNVIEKDKMQAIEAYSGIVIHYEGKKEVIPIVLKLDSLEYDLILAIKKLTSERIPTIGVLTTDRTMFSDGASIVREAIEKQYQVNVMEYTEAINLNEIDTLIVYQPENVSKNVVYAIDQFIMNGGEGLFLVDQHKIDGLQVTKINTGIDSMLSHYGVTIEHALTMDRSNSAASFSSGFVNFTLPYPFWPKLLKKNFLTDHPILQKIETFVLPWSSPLKYKVQANKEATFTTLASTTKNAWTQKEPYNLNPQQKFKPTAYEQYPMVVNVTGTLASFFSDNQLETSTPFKTTNSDSNILIVGNSTFITNQMVQQFPNNKTVLLNLLDFLTLDNDIFGIPNRINADSPIRNVPDSVKPIIKWSTTLFFPICITFYGLIRYWVIKKSKEVTNR